MRSKSVAQLSSIVLIFDPGTDLLNARQLVSGADGHVTPTLPTWAAPPVMLQPLSSTSRVMKIGLASDTMNLIEISMIGLLEYPGPPAPGSGSGERRNLGRTPGNAPGPG